MALVDSLISEPRWFSLATATRFGEILTHLAYLGVKRVVVTSAYPLVTYCLTILNKAIFVPAPHQYGRVVTPTLRHARQHSQYLVSLNALLAKSFVVQDSGALRKVWVGQESLNCRDPLEIPSVVSFVVRVVEKEVCATCWTITIDSGSDE